LDESQPGVLRSWLVQLRESGDDRSLLWLLQLVARKSHFIQPRTYRELIHAQSVVQPSRCLHQLHYCRRFRAMLVLVRATISHLIARQMQASWTWSQKLATVRNNGRGG